MREIKFRFWDGKKMIYNGYSEADCYFHGLLVCEGDTIPLQYTGLKDKNGKEIYEGDVVVAQIKPNLVIGDDVPSTHKMVVVWDERGKWSMEGGVASMGVPWCLGNFDITIIGNIYENPELRQK